MSAVLSTSISDRISRIGMINRIPADKPKTYFRSDFLAILKYVFGLSAGILFIIPILLILSLILVDNTAFNGGTHDQ